MNSPPPKNNSQDEYAIEQLPIVISEAKPVIEEIIQGNYQESNFLAAILSIVNYDKKF